MFSKKKNLFFRNGFFFVNKCCSWFLKYIILEEMGIELFSFLLKTRMVENKELIFWRKWRYSCGTRAKPVVTDQQKNANG